jgi:hypothetical protein
MLGRVLPGGGVLGTCRLAGLGAAGDQDVQTGDHCSIKEAGGIAGQGPEAHEVLEVVGQRDGLDQRPRKVSARQRTFCRPLSLNPRYGTGVCAAPP